MITRKSDKVNPITIWKRIFMSNTPAFFKKLRWIFLTCTALGIGFKTTDPADTAWLLDTLPLGFPGMLITVGMIGTALTSLPIPESDKRNIDNA